MTAVETRGFVAEQSGVGPADDGVADLLRRRRGNCLRQQGCRPCNGRGRKRRSRNNEEAAIGALGKVEESRGNHIYAHAPVGGRSARTKESGLVEIGGVKESAEAEVARRGESRGGGAVLGRRDGGGPGNQGPNRCGGARR